MIAYMDFSESASTSPPDDGGTPKWVTIDYAHRRVMSETDVNEVISGIRAPLVQSPKRESLPKSSHGKRQKRARRAARR